MAFDAVCGVTWIYKKKTNYHYEHSPSHCYKGWHCLNPYGKSSRKSSSTKSTQVVLQNPPHPSLDSIRTNWTPRFRTKMKLYLQAALILTSTFTNIGLVSSITCRSNCAACWNDDNSDVDIKFTCDDGDCGTKYLSTKLPWCALCTSQALPVSGPLDSITTHVYMYTVYHVSMRICIVFMILYT